MFMPWSLYIETVLVGTSCTLPSWWILIRLLLISVQRSWFGVMFMCGSLSIESFIEDPSSTPLSQKFLGLSFPKPDLIVGYSDMGSWPLPLSVFHNVICLFRCLPSFWVVILTFQDASGTKQQLPAASSRNL